MATTYTKLIQIGSAQIELASQNGAPVRKNLITAILAPKMVPHGSVVFFRPCASPRAFD
ncbi:MAG: hypothetical protein GY820_20900 [Gammaproteobacteria bacterium]|nr:hypothetical protein [Gammaproteobacteria bacterium]